MDKSAGKLILDACCGSKMFWFNKHHPNAVYIDNRATEQKLCDGRMLKVSPDVVANFKDLPFDDNTFKLVVFDPPHLLRAGEASWLRAKYGVLDKDTWQEDLRKGFAECMRVLDAYGVLVFKWNEEQIKLKDLLNAIEAEPLIGDKRAKTHWLLFMKED